MPSRVVAVELSNEEKELLDKDPNAKFATEEDAHYGAAREIHMAYVPKPRKITFTGPLGYIEAQQPPVKQIHTSDIGKAPQLAKLYEIPPPITNWALRYTRTINYT